MDTGSEKPAIKMSHAAVLMPLHPLGPVYAANAFGMDTFHIRHISNFPTLRPETRTPAHTSAMQKTSFVPEANLIHCFFMNQHKCTGTSLFAHRFFRQRPLMHNDTFKPEMTGKQVI